MNQKEITCLLAALVVSSAFVGGTMAITPTIDTETSDTPSTSDLVDGTTINNFSADPSKASYLNASFSGTPSDEIVVEIHKNDDPNTTYVSLRGGFSKTYENTSSGTEYYARNISHEDFSTIPMAGGESKTVDIRVYVAGDATNYTTIDNVTLQNVEGRHVVRVSEQSVNNDSMVDFGERGIISSETTATVDDEVILNKSETNRTVTYVFAESQTANASSLAAEEATAGEWLPYYGAYAEGTALKVYQTNAPSDVAGTYGVHQTDDGQETVTYHVADSYDKQAIEFETRANDHVSVFDILDGNGALGLAQNFEFSDLGTAAVGG